MGQSLVKNYLHVVFSTKNRAPIMRPEILMGVSRYIVGISKNIDSPVLSIGGTRDHIHILVSLSKSLTLVQYLQKVKMYSSKWVKSSFKDASSFSWQDGYAAISVNPTEKDKVAQYILNQEEHHRQRSFEQELILLLKKYEVEYNEDYLLR
jgi:REP element-mobilizing transposase RayT